MAPKAEKQAPLVDRIRAQAGMPPLTRKRAPSTSGEGSKKAKTKKTGDTPKETILKFTTSSPHKASLASTSASSTTASGPPLSSATSEAESNRKAASQIPSAPRTPSISPTEPFDGRGGAASQAPEDVKSEIKSEGPESLGSWVHDVDSGKAFEKAFEKTGAHLTEENVAAYQEFLKQQAGSMPKPGQSSSSTSTLPPTAQKTLKQMTDCQVIGRMLGTAAAQW